jgi:hypothetical protein
MTDTAGNGNQPRTVDMVRVDLVETLIVAAT